MKDDPMRHAPAALAPSLGLAVPLHIWELRNRTADQLVAVGKRCANEVAAHGDDILFRAKRKSATAHAFNALAQGLAVLAHAPGGVDFAGLHFEVPDSPLTDPARVEQVRRRIADIGDTHGRL